MASKILFLAGSLGLLLPACAGTPETTGVAASDVTADPYFESAAFRALAPPVADAVRASHAAAPGPASRAALVAVVSGVTFRELGARYDATSCISSGVGGQLEILEWVAASVAHGTNDADRAAALDALGAVLAAQPLASIDAALDGVRAGLALRNVQPPFASSTCPVTKETKTTKTFTLNRPVIESLDAASALASMFQAADSATVAPALVRDWNDLRTRWQTSLARRSPDLASALRTARHAGSATLSRAGGAFASRKFDQAAALVERFVAHDVAVTPGAMNLLHAVVADRDHGELRTAGRDVRQGRKQDRMYLPGSAVAPAVGELFAEIGRRAGKATAPALAATVDQRLISIHPYVDANGRTTRLMTDWILARAGFPPAIATAQESTALFWQRLPDLGRADHLERVTAGMRRAVSLAETVVG